MLPQAVAPTPRPRSAGPGAGQPATWRPAATRPGRRCSRGHLEPVSVHVYEYEYSISM